MYHVINMTIASKLSEMELGTGLLILHVLVYYLNSDQDEINRHHFTFLHQTG
ncbi:hypothetical protein ACJX0J_012707, partial [Zea mays]